MELLDGRWSAPEEESIGPSGHLANSTNGVRVLWTP